MMKILRLGSKGPDVEKWQNFLRGLFSCSIIIANGNFDAITESETKSFQSNKGLTPDGIVGPKTLAAALQSGFLLMHDEAFDIDGPSWPKKPLTKPLSRIEREKLFGKFSYSSSPTPSNPEAITIKGNWEKNIVQVTIPQLSKVSGVPKSLNISIHSAISLQFVKLFKEWENAGLNGLVMSWGGSWAPRFIRGSRTVLSNHAWATAFDINVQWNQLGAQPALRGKTGSVRELVEIAHDNGFYWGGWFSKRPDGMHFEAYKIL